MKIAINLIGTLTVNEIFLHLAKEMSNSLMILGRLVMMIVWRLCIRYPHYPLCGQNDRQMMCMLQCWTPENV